MNSNKAILTLATILLPLIGSAASPAYAVEGVLPVPEVGGLSAAAGLDAYSDFIADEITPQDSAVAPGFAGYMDDAMAAKSASCSSGACDIDLGEPDVCDNCYASCDGSCSTRLWMGVDYLMLWTKGRYLPPLVSTGIPGQDGVVGLPSTTFLFGGGEVGEEFRAGGRFSLGAWLDPCERWGVGGRFLIGETDEANYAAASNVAGVPLLARPFFNTDLIAGVQDSLIIARQNIRRGNIAAQAANDLMNLDAYFRVLLYQCGNRRLDLLAGYQFSQIEDSLNINHRMVQLGGNFPVGTQFAFQDSFDTRNSFHGAALGLQGEYCYGGLTLSMVSKLGLGNMRQLVTIDGASTVIDPAGNRQDYLGGLLALPTNIDTYESDAFSVVPEVEVKLLYQVTSRLNVSVGYSFVYWTNVALAADQIDTSVQNTPTVNASQLLGGALAPGAPANPAFNGIRDAGFWAQGLTFGVTLKH